MRETAEFRVDEKFASMLFADNEGKRLGRTVRKIEIDTTDPRYARIGELQRELLATQGKLFFYGWHITWTPSQQEFEDAKMFLLRPTAHFEPAGEQCGTVYDESFACAHCGAGARQVGPLLLVLSRIPKGVDIARTIAGEMIISLRAVELFERHKITGVNFSPIMVNRASRAASVDWYQLTVESSTADIVPPTRVGIKPFDEDPEGKCRCPVGDLLGLAL